MSTWKARGAPEMKRVTLLLIIVAMGFSMNPSPTCPCSCNWRGPFLSVVKDAPLVILGRVLRHHPGQKPSMDVLVLETLSGGLLDSGMVVQMGDGMQCRPSLDSFPPRSEWILALNGPGSKPGNGFALSHCGEYWVRIEGKDIVGSIDGTQSQIKRMPLLDFMKLFQTIIAADKIK